MRNKKILTILIIIIIAILGFAIFKKFNPTIKIPTTEVSKEGQLSEKQIKQLINKISKLIKVPDEEPVIATIVKADQLIAEQKFYAGSKDGDYLIIFPKAQKAIIYRKNEDILINVGPIFIDQPNNNTNTTKVNNTENQNTSTTTTNSTNNDKKDKNQ